MKTVSAALAGLLLIPSVALAMTGTISGTCRVVDGDTIWVDSQGTSTQVRLNGVAAPEDPREPGGKQATSYMKKVCGVNSYPA